MVTKSLSDTPINELVACLAASFEGYFVKLPEDVSFWQNRWKAARVDYSLSFGAFDRAKLVGFIINGIDEDNQQQKTAFNVGTGILPAYRGRQLVDRLYQYAFPYFQEHRILKCGLEVIDQNDRAISVYERIGFRKQRRLKCYGGTIAPDIAYPVVPEKIALERLKNKQPYYSWENSWPAIAIVRENYQAFQVMDDQGSCIGSFIINPATGYIAQLEAQEGKWAALFQGIRQLCPQVKLNNVDESRKDLIAFLQGALPNPIDQFEMELVLD